MVNIFRTSQFLPTCEPLREWKTANYEKQGKY